MQIQYNGTYMSLPGNTTCAKVIHMRNAAALEIWFGISEWYFQIPGLWIFLLSVDVHHDTCSYYLQ